MKIPENKLAISLVTYNAERYLPFCLSSLFEQSFNDFSVLVIDNGSSDRTIQHLKENYPQIKIVSHSSNIGFAKAHNQAISWSKAKYICLLNQDVILEKDYLKNLVEFLDYNEKVASVTGKILSWDFKNNKKLTNVDSKGLKVFKNHMVVDIDQGLKDVPDLENEVFGTSGAAPIYRIKSLNDVKLKNSLGADEYFDELFFSYKEDVDLAYRFRLAGFKSYYIPSSIAYHDRTVKGKLDVSNKAIIKARKNRDKMVKIYSYKNHLQTLCKNEFFTNFIKYFFHITWYEFRKIMYIIFLEPSTLKGLVMFFKQRKYIKQKRKYIKKNIRKIKSRELSKWYI